jgi:short-subunit dehydrogenase
LRCIRAVLPVMRARGKGQIINISSTVGKRSLPYLGGYSATKFALHALSESLRVEVADEGIDVILVLPGLTQGDFQANILSSRKDVPDVPMKFAQTPAEVAEAIVRASKRRAREVVLSASGRVLLTLNAMSPALVDRALGRAARRFVSK